MTESIQRRIQRLMDRQEARGYRGWFIELPETLPPGIWECHTQVDACEVYGVFGMCGACGYPIPFAAYGVEAPGTCLVCNAIARGCATIPFPPDEP